MPRSLPPPTRDRILNEIRILEKIDHDNIITFYTSWYNRHTKQIVFITELMNNHNNGSLYAFVQPIPILRWRIVKRWLRQILEGLAFLHSQVGSPSPPLPPSLPFVWCVSYRTLPITPWSFLYACLLTLPPALPLEHLLPSSLFPRPGPPYHPPKHQL